jgi:hypothetical protein
MPFESTESEDYNHEYYKEPEYELEKREAFEDEGIYDVFSDEYPADASSTEYSENMDNLCTFDRSLKGYVVRMISLILTLDLFRVSSRKTD